MNQFYKKSKLFLMNINEYTLYEIKNNLYNFPFTSKIKFFLKFLRIFTHQCFIVSDNVNIIYYINCK